MGTIEDEWVDPAGATHNNLSISMLSFKWYRYEEWIIDLHNTCATMLWTGLHEYDVGCWQWIAPADNPKDIDELVNNLIERLNS